MSSSESPSPGEYHAWQRALNADQEAQTAKASASAARRALREIETCLLAALARLDEGEVSAVRDELGVEYIVVWSVE